jgi:hypothetical protein
MKKNFALHNSVFKIFCVVALSVFLINCSYAQTINTLSAGGTTSFVVGSTISASAKATAPSHGSISNVTFTIGTVSEPGASSGSTYSASIPTSGLSPGVYQLQATNNYKNSNRSTGSIATAISITIVPLAPTAPGVASCGPAGSRAVTLTAQPSDSFTGGTYKWYTTATTPTAISGATSSTYTPTISAATTYYVSYIYNNIESARTSVAITVGTPPDPTFTAVGAVNVGATSEIFYGGTDPSSSTFTWDFDGGTVVSGSGTRASRYEVSWGSPGEHTVSLTVTNTAGCSSTSGGIVTVSAVALSSYGFSKPIVLNTSSAGISTTLSSFPALVYIKDPALIIGNLCGDKVQFPLGNGGSLPAGTNYDFAFTLPGSSTELNYQVENYDSTNGILLAWVQVPNVTNVNTPLTFYFGSLTPGHSAAFSEATWTSDYLAVYHFIDAAAANAGATSPIQDATSNNVAGTPTSVTVGTDEIHTKTGLLSGTGGGYNFNGNGSKIITNKKADIIGPFTLSAWVYVTNPNNDNKIVSNELNFGPGYKLSVKKGKIEVETRSTNAENQPPSTNNGLLDDDGNLGDGGAITANTWHYVQGVFTGNGFQNYLDGVPQATGRNSNTDPITPLAGGNVTMGLDHGDMGNIPISTNVHVGDANFFGGVMDEVRVSNVVKSADWIVCEYANQSNPVGFTDWSEPIFTYQPNASALVGAATYTWKGTNSTNATDAGNWDTSPTAFTNGNASWNIPVSTNYPQLTVDMSIYELTIANGAKLDLNGHTLSVGCNIYNNATTGGTGILSPANISTSGINWDGQVLTAQSYNGTNNPNTAEIGNMTLNNSAGGNITINGGPIDLFSELTLTKGSLIVNNAGNGALTLKSNGTQTAAVGVIPSSSSVQGIVNVERFLTGGGLPSNRGYRFLSSPVNQTSAVPASTNTFGLFYLNKHEFGGITYDGVFTSGPVGPANGFSIVNNNATMFLYNESLVFNNDSFTLGNHVPINAITSTPAGGSTAGNITTSTETLGTLPASTTVSLPVGNGFLMYFIGSTTTRTNTLASIAPDNTVMTANGYLNQGTIPVSLWFTPSSGAGKLSYTALDAHHPYPGFNMVGNPYACTIDMAKVISDNIVSIDAIYVLSAKDSPNQFYIAYTANGASAPNMNYAESGEGFMVHATANGDKTLTFQESEKVPAGQLGSASLLALRRPGISTTNSVAALEPQSNVLTGLYMKMEKDSANYSYCGIYFRSDWSDKFAEDDAIDMNGTSGVVTMSSLTSDKILTPVNHMSDYTKGINVKLYANASANGTYDLKIEGIRNIDTLYDIYLLDHYKKDSLDIRKYGTYAFDISKSDTSSFGGSRFELSIHPHPLPAYKLLNFTAQKITGGVQLNWKTEGEANYTGFVLQKQDGTTFNPLYTKQSDSSGTYIFIDHNPVIGDNTYRLQQSNIVNNLSYSSPVTVIYNPSGADGAISIYPNPTKATISVNVATVASDTAPSYKANIYNSVGQLMMQKTVTNNSWTQDVTQYTPGTYIIQMTDSNGSLVGKSKFVKTN